MLARPVLALSLVASFALVAATASAPASAAIAIDGQLDPDYPAAIVVQITQTGLSGGGQIPGDNNLGDLNYASGSELDAAHAVVEGGVLRLFLPGNLALRLVVNQNRTTGHVLDVFFDTAPGGQAQLTSIGSGNPLNGLTFDPAFTADYWFEFLGDGNQFSTEWHAGRGELFTPNGGTFAGLGFSAAGGPGTLVGGTNPFGVKVTIDNRNIGGVTFGCNAASGAGVTRGIEWEIPLAAIGNPQGCFRLAVIVRDNSAGSNVSNQVLGPVPPGTCPLGSAQFVNFASVAGEQFFTVCGAPVGVPGRGPAAALSLALAGAHPARGDRLVFTFALPDARPGTLDLFDVAGRVVRSHRVEGAGTIDLAQGRRLRPGLYWARVAHGGSSLVRRVIVGG
ncbi:MAG: T9SS type A sorting domain-containing protein [Candidatus Eisenbacteria bacterium]